MAARGTVAVEASVEVIQSFVDANRRRYESDLEQLKGIIADLRGRDRSLRCIYKVYSRGELQGGEELKSPRKIRLKFNEFNVKARKAFASVFDVPDIVGLTIVVPNPSDISIVAAALDAAIDRNELNAVALPGAAKGTAIKTVYGRPLETGGYFACHYNVRLDMMSDAAPICEIQIKTLLHDAWGAKTHDLTYKPSGKIGAELLTSFELLGANLANLDQQSDALRQSIVRNASVREVKRRRIQVCVLSYTALQRATLVTDGGIRGELETIHRSIMAMTDATPDEMARPISNKLSKLFKKEKRATSSLLCLLAAMVQRQLYTEKALESISAREQDATDPLDTLHIRFEGALAAFAVNDVPRAIDIAELCYGQARRMKKEKLVDGYRLASIMLRVCSDLAYYHADLIGSHEGDKRGSTIKAKSYLKGSMALYRRMDFPRHGIESADNDVIDALAASKFPLWTFFALDNEVYVRVQTAETEADLRHFIKRLEFLHCHVPSGGEHAARLATDYHDYCARQRLADLEGLSVS